MQFWKTAATLVLAALATAAVARNRNCIVVSWEAPRCIAVAHAS